MNRAIGDVARMLDTSADTLRYYEKIRLIPRPTRDAGGRRSYSDKDIERLRFARNAQALGFSLADIRQLVKLRDAPHRARPEVRSIAELKCREVEDKIQALQSIHGELSLLLNLCQGPDQRGDCPILHGFEDRPQAAEPEATRRPQVRAANSPTDR